MTTETRRRKLRNFIDTAEDETIDASYTILEYQLRERYVWWEDDEFVAELEDRVCVYEGGEDKGVSWEEVKAKVRSRLNRA